MSNFTQKTSLVAQKIFRLPFIQLSYVQGHLLKVDAKKSSFGVLRLFSSQNEVKKADIAPKNILHLHERGIFQDIFPPASVNLPKRFEKRQCFYSGFDPTADSLHVGNLLSIMALLNCQRAGHDVIAVIGTATAKAGDPSGHTKDRTILTDEVLRKNAKALSESIQNISENHAEYLYRDRHTNALPPLKILFNHTWYDEIAVIDFITSTCKNIRVGPMMEKRFIRERIDSLEGLSLAEFMYQALQAYDWKHLRKNYNCCFQVGGLDQLGNISAGHDLIRKSKKEEIYGLFTPLVTTPRGEKLGKSAGNSIWLNPKKTSPFEFYQFFYRQPDAVVERFLKYFTFIELKQIELIMFEHNQHPHRQQAQKILARNVCKIVHGEKGLRSAELCTRCLYEGNLDDVEKLSDEEMEVTFAGTNFIQGILEPDTTVYDLAVNVAKAIPSGNKGENLIIAGGLRINGQVVDYPHQVLMPDVHVLKNDLTLLTVGKRHHFVIRWKLPRIEHDEIDDGEPPSNQEIPGVDVEELTRVPAEEVDSR